MATGAAPYVDATVPGAFRAIAAARPDAVAIDGDAGSITFSTLDATTDALARAIDDASRAGSEPVAVLLPHGGAVVAGVLGALKTGRPYTVLDPSYPTAYLQRVCARVRPALMLTDARTAPLASRLAPSVPSLDHATAVAERLPGDSTRSIEPGAVASILFTSGSTGDPKGVVHSHRNIVFNAQNAWGALQPDDRVAFVLSAAFGGGSTAMFRTLLNGATLCPYDMTREAMSFSAWATSNRITVLHIQPSLLRALTQRRRPEDDLSGVRLVGLIGEPSFGHDITHLRTVLPTDCRIVSRMSTMETNVYASFTIGPDDDVPDGIVPAGTVAPWIQVDVVDEHGDALPAGTTGELVVTGDHLALGYWDDTTQTNARFSIGADGRRSFRTGDLGRFAPNGLLEHGGRIDARVKVRGMSVDGDAVAHEIAALPDVREAAVSPIETARGTRLVAHVVPEGPAPLSGRELRRRLGARMPGPMVPSTIVIVRHLPRNVRGKVDRASLRAEAAEQDDTRYSAPRTPTEQRVAALFAEVLDLAPGEVGRDDDFFDRGADSLAAVELLHGVLDELGTEVAPSTLVQCPTPAALAAAIEGDEGVDGRAQAPSTVVVLAHGGASTPPFVCVAGGGAHALGFRALALRITDRTVLGVHAHGVERRAVPDRSVERRARRHIADIRRVHPRGPYLVGGHSFGGVVAYEIAQQLRDAGDDVELLVLLDSGAPGRQRAGGPEDVAAARLRARYPGARAKDRMRRATRLAYIAARRRTLGFLAGIVRLAPARQTVAFVRLNAAMGRKYRPRPYDGPVLLVRAGDDLGSYDPRWRLPDRGWGSLLRGDVTAADIDAPHTALANEPYAQEVGRILTDAFAAVERPPHRPATMKP